MKGALETERVRAEVQVDEGEVYSRKEGFFELRYLPVARPFSVSSALWRFLVFGRSGTT